MTGKAKKYLSDISLAINNINQFMKGVDNFYDYNNDPKTQNAVERQLSIFGEEQVRANSNHLRRDISLDFKIKEFLDGRIRTFL